ncbi:hypothetical protein LDENG_00130110 [Lucifuga dentata]|nr:hypothetical protein LDENG_00130110 [Lucifuga dentata]
MEVEIGVPSIQAFIRRCRCTQKRAKCYLRYQQQANCCRVPAPLYVARQKVWLSTKNLPLRVECHKLALHFMGTFPIFKVINPAAVRLCLPKSMRVHATFHVSNLKPVQESPLVHLSPDLLRVLISLMGSQHTQSDSFCAPDVRVGVCSI